MAKRAKISPTSVSLVLNDRPNTIAEATKKRIFQAAKELNYQPNYFAKSLKTQKSNIIGVLIPTLTNPFFAEYASQLNYYAKKRGYSIFINEYKDNLFDVNDALGNFLKYNVAGIIIIQFNLDETMIEDIANLKTPFVIADSLRADPKSDYSTVIIDNYQGGVMATEYLIRHGHRKIGCYTGPRSLESTKIRIQAYNDTLDKYHIDKRFFFEGTYNIGNEDEALDYFLANDCTAIFSLNDIMALGLYKSARKRQVTIPDALSIIGFDNIPSTELVYPELTTIEQPLDEISESAINILIHNIENTKYNKKTVLQPKIIERKSVLDLTKK